MKYESALVKLYHGVQTYQDLIVGIDNANQSGEPRKGQSTFQSQLYNATAFLGEIRQSMEESVTGEGQVRQRVRVCEDNESLFLLCLLLGLLVAITLAVFSIYMLHRIAEYEVR